MSYRSIDKHTVANMLGLPPNASTFLTAAIVLLGAFTRFTHGQYTPWFYKYQQYHQADDGGTIARIIPIVDTLLGSMILWPRTRLFALVVVDLFFVMGMFVQIRAGKHWGYDAMSVVLATSAIWESARR